MSLSPRCRYRYHTQRSPVYLKESHSVPAFDFLLSSPAFCYLLCTSECFLIDANVFRTRYANGNMKIILFDDGNLEKIDAKSWIAGNGWWCEVVSKDETTAVNWLIEDKTQGVLIVR